jgi:hypothetical protein
VAVSKHDFFLQKEAKIKGRDGGGYADSRKEVDGEENLEKSLQILFWGKKESKKKKKQSNFEVFGIRFKTCALVKACSEQEYWVVVFMIRVRQPVCLLSMNSTTNKQLIV